MTKPVTAVAAPGMLRVRPGFKYLPEYARASGRGLRTDCAAPVHETVD
jgi:hypothetical protein